jgi:hypothetical protein
LPIATISVLRVNGWFVRVNVTLLTRVVANNTTVYTQQGIIFNEFQNALMTKGRPLPVSPGGVQFIII